MPFARLLLALLIVLLVVPGGSSAPVAAAPSQQDIGHLYLLPIVDGAISERRVQDVVDRLGRGGDRVKVGISGVYRYMAEVDPNADYQIQTEGLRRIADAAVATNVPFLVHLNGGRWAGGGPLVERLMEDPWVMSWDDQNRHWSYPKDGEYFFSLTTNNALLRKYKQRNLQAAAHWLADFAGGPNGSLLVGVSTDSEVLINTHPGYDYNPAAINEWVQWLASDDAYDPVHGRWAGQGLGLSLKDVNQRYGAEYRRWKDVRPPRQPEDSPAWRDWQRFRELLVDHNVQEQADWIREAGLRPNQIFSHQSPALDVPNAADTLDAAQVDGGSTGITTYGERTNDPALFERVRGFGAPWGIVEYNPRTDDEALARAGLDAVLNAGATVLCPYHWDDEGGENEAGYTIRDTPFERALQTFVAAANAAPQAEGTP
ncbi:MAG: beta-galactosidase [Chloroflexi bacterium]|nr:beta-galactosidase [Chloroflexota bacterium]